MSDEDQYDRVCKGRFDHIDAKLAVIDGLLRGSTGEAGMSERVRRLEGMQTRQASAARGWRELFMALLGRLASAGLIGGVGALIAWAAMRRGG